MRLLYADVLGDRNLRPAEAKRPSAFNARNSYEFRYINLLLGAQRSGLTPCGSPFRIIGLPKTA
jgi:hypothetical protein